MPIQCPQTMEMIYFISLYLISKMDSNFGEEMMRKLHFQTGADLVRSFSLLIAFFPLQPDGNRCLDKDFQSCQKTALLGFQTGNKFDDA
jgi:hypothetical protein